MIVKPGQLRLPRRRAFTLAELLVVIGIILIVMAVALPAFTVIVGSRSVEAGRNIVASSIVRARGEAIRRGQPCGVFFYVDPDTRRTGAAIVVLDPLTDPDPYDEYKAFYRGGAGPQRDYQGGTHDPLPDEEDEPAMTADRVLVLGSDENTLRYTDRYAAFSGRPIVLTMKHTNLPAGDGLTDPGDTAGVPLPVIGAGNAVDSRDRRRARESTSNDFWNLEGVDVGFLELIEGIETRLLPPGIGLQVILGETLEPDTAGDAAFRERYARYGLILFDNQGRLLQAEYQINQGSRLARVMGLDVNLPIVPPIGDWEFPRSQLGVVIYDNEAFDTAAGDGTAREWTGDRITSLDAAVIEQFTTSDGDSNPPWRDFNRILGDPMANMQLQDRRREEYAEERWLDFNTIPLMVNRYSGMLIEAE